MLDHVGLNVSDHDASRAFYEASLKPIGIEPIIDHDGVTGFGEERPYHEHYYGAFVLDPDGNNVEAVCHLPEG